MKHGWDHETQPAGRFLVTVHWRALLGRPALPPKPRHQPIRSDHRPLERPSAATASAARMRRLRGECARARPRKPPLHGRRSTEPTASSQRPPCTSSTITREFRRSTLRCTSCSCMGWWTARWYSAWMTSSAYRPFQESTSWSAPATAAASGAPPDLPMSGSATAWQVAASRPASPCAPFWRRQVSSPQRGGFSPKGPTHA